MITLFCIRPKGFNVGNDAIFLGTQYFINEAFGDSINLISLPATSRYETHDRAGLTSRTIHEINQYGHGVIVGGGNLYENGELEIDVDALQCLEVPLMLFSLSMGRIYNRRGELVRRTDAMPDPLLTALDDAASYSLARDGATKSYLEKAGSRKCILGGCPTVFLDRMISFLPDGDVKSAPDAVLSIRNPDLMNIPLQKQARVREDIEGIIDFLRSQGLNNIQMLCHDHRDIPFAASFPAANYVFKEDVYSFLALLRASPLSISYRLHATLPSISFGRPSIKISYDERALSLMETVGLGDWNINMLEEEDVLSAVIDRYRRLGDLDKLKEEASPLWDQMYTSMTNTFSAFAADVRGYYDLR